MPLVLTVLRCPDNVPPETRQISGGDFSIGRGPENNWVLQDPERLVSKQHCVVAYRGGVWQIAGTSGNGTFLNHDNEPLESGAPRALEDGDRVHIGPYEIEVRLQEEAARAAFGGNAGREARPYPFGEDPFGAPHLPGFGGHAASPSAAPGASGNDMPASSSRLPVEFDPLSPDLPEEAIFGQTQDDHSAAINDALHLAPSRSVLPDDWDLESAVFPGPGASVPRAEPPAELPPVPPSYLATSPAAQAPARPAVALPASPGGGEQDLLAAFLRGARLPDAAPPDPAVVMEQLGAAFRATVSGVRLALAARAAIKREFRIDQTTVRSSGNNPLKFSTSDDDAMAALLGAGRRTDLTAEDALADALADIRLHELVTMAATQVAARALIARLAPDALRRAAEKAGSIGWPGAAKARAWDLFEKLHHEITQSLADDFDSAFGKSFARAYEQALTEITRRNRRP